MMLPNALYQVAHTKHAQYSALEKTQVVHVGRIALAVGLSTVCTILVTLMTSLKTSLRNTEVGTRDTCTTNLSKSDISPELLYYLRS